MSDLPERVYALRKIGPGDWVTLSNDGREVWRFHQHVDGAIHGLCDGLTGEPVPYEERTYWRAVHAPADRVRISDLDHLLDDLWSPPWIEDDWYLPTRRAAVERMLLAGAVPA